MERTDLPELHFITPIQNLASILQHGILSHRRAEQLPHDSVANAEVQDRRQVKMVPGGRPLHEYVNLYLCARNPMMFLRQDAHPQLCVLRVSTGVLDLPGVVVTDGNAASGPTAFYPSPAGLAYLDAGLIFAVYWTDPDPIVQTRKKRAKCAEVLVPDRVDPQLILGAYVSSSDAGRTLQVAAPDLNLTVNAHLFFA